MKPHTTRTTIIIITAVFVISLGRSFPVHAQDAPATGSEHGDVAKTQEPAILKTIIAAHWRVPDTREFFPAVLDVHEEKLETQDWIDYTYDGGGFHLYVSPGPNGGDIFAVLVDTRVPRYHDFATPAFAEHYAAYHRGPYVVVVPVHPVSQKLFEELKTKRWTEAELRQEIGTASYHAHAHGGGYFHLHYIPQGLEFIGYGPNLDIMYQVRDEEGDAKVNMPDATLPPLDSLAKTDYAKVQIQNRVQFAKRLFDEHEEPDPTAPLFDGQYAHQWTVVQATSAAFGKEHPETWVQLLKSISPAGESGVGSPLYAVNLLVFESRPDRLLALLYSFAPLTVPTATPTPLPTATPIPPTVPPFTTREFDLRPKRKRRGYEHTSRRTDNIFYMDDQGAVAGPPLELRDVTGDHIPEIIFHSGFTAADDSITDIHVIQYSNAGFRDIRADRFSESMWQKFRWLDLDGQTVGIVAEHMKPSDDPYANCEQCPKFHRYDVYRWDQTQGKFSLSETIPSTGKLHSGENPFETDWAYIMAKLHRAASSTSEPHDKR